MQAQEARPPYVTFEAREIEDREASTAAGHYVGKDIDYALICPQGSKDRVERIVSEWFVHIQAEVDNDRFPLAWLRAYKEAYEAWKSGYELPETGTAIKSWPVLSPAQISLLLALRVRTVEDLAQLNDEGLQRIGMGARALKQKAVDWLEASKDSGKLVQELEALRVQNEQLLARDLEREKGFQQMRAEIDAIQAAATGNKKL
jgi:hypothetical protein